MDLHRRRSVLVRMTETGEHLETTRIVNDRDQLADVMSRAGESPADAHFDEPSQDQEARATNQNNTTVGLDRPLSFRNDLWKH
jgi:hypothetical protein